MVGTLLSPRSHHENNFFKDGKPVDSKEFEAKQCIAICTSTGKQCKSKSRTCIEGKHKCLRHGSTNTCSICLEECGASGCVTTICKHRFHKNCIDKWDNNTCPLCRTIIGDPEIYAILYDLVLASESRVDFIERVADHFYTHGRIERII